MLRVDNPAGYHAGLYIRLSKEDEREGPSESIRNQKFLLEAFAKQNLLDVYDTYIDDGWSGTNFDRPNFNRLLEDIEAGKVNLVITKDLSRLGRDYILTGHYMERYFPEHRVRYISLLDGIDTGVDSTANDITPFRAILNDMYAKDISKKISSVKHDKQRRGLFIGGKPVYGYKMHPTEKNHIIPDETVAPIVRRIFGMALEGVSCRQIACQLNAEKIPPPAVYANLPIARRGPYSGLWSGERISAMLQNETYLGNMVQGRSRKVSYKSKKCIHQPREDWIVVPGTHEPLVSQATFSAVQRLLQKRRRTRNRTYDFLLKGLIFCRECGSPLAVLNRKNAKGEDVLYFVCRTYQRLTKAGICTSHCVQEKTVTEAVMGKVRETCEAYLTPEWLLPVAESAIKEANRAHCPRDETQDLQDKIDRLAMQLDQMYMDRLSGLLPEADFQRIYQHTQLARDAFKKQLDALTRQTESPACTGDMAKELVRRFLDSAFTNRELLCSLIERVELTEEKKIILRFRFPKPDQPGA